MPLSKDCMKVHTIIPFCTVISFHPSHKLYMWHDSTLQKFCLKPNLALQLHLYVHWSYKAYAYSGNRDTVVRTAMPVIGQLVFSPTSLWC